MDRTERTAIWKGLNRMPYIGDGEMRDMKNLSSDAYPFITTRKGRKPYTFITKIPSPEGEAYRDIERLPEPCHEEMGNVYKLTKDAVTAEYKSGTFYYYNGSEWTEGIKDATFLGTTETAEEFKRKLTLLSYYDLFENTTYATYAGKELGTEPEGFSDTTVPSFEFMRDRVKYLGTNNGIFKKGKTYIYKVHIDACWVAGFTDNVAKIDVYEKLPAPSYNAGTAQYRYHGENYSETYSYYNPITGEKWTETVNFTDGNYYRRYMSGYGYWEEVPEEESQIYDIVESMPENPAINQQVRFINKAYGAPIPKGSYCCKAETDTEGNLFYYWDEAAEGGNNITYLPQPSADLEGETYCYTGLTAAGEFAKCSYNKEGYEWKAIEHPQVERVVTIKDYLDNYDGSGLREIIEIGSLNGKMAALIVDGNGTYKLFYDEKLCPVSNISEESGKKLLTVGNRLIVGESGCHLHLKETKNEEGTVTGSETIYTEMGSAFSSTVIATDFLHGNGGDLREEYLAYGRPSGNAHFLFYKSPEEAASLKIIYEGLKNQGTDFSVSSKNTGSKQYLTVESISFRENAEVGAWKVGDFWYHDYATVLEITASGASGEFDWYSKTNDVLVFESTEPHYYDVVAWKKRLWGYNKNILHGTVADIFDNYDMVDWNTGNNTYTEAISQPLWQGGNISGIAALMNGLVYFKEDCITIVTGNYPAVMSSSTIPCRGLPPENRRSVAVANECVYYLSTDGVYRFDGNIPRCISRDVKISGTDAVGASDGNKYWLSLKEDSGKYALYVFDINYGIWHKEDATQAVSFVMLGGEMHMAVGTEIYNLNSPQEDVSWECELWYDEGTHRKKKYKEIVVRGSVGECELYLKPDDGDWKLIGAVQNKMRMKFIPFDCEELHLKLRGKGICEIKSIDRTFEIVG